MISTRFIENFAHFKYNASKKSAKATHWFETDHCFNKNNTKLLK